jgi:transcriptional regulator with XRE-family HTH domain
MSRQLSFASSLRSWRRHRGLSQLDLAGRTEISQRHLSFMELGRASPSRDMVMRLAAALDVPLRQHNALLISAGFAPVWRQTNLAAPELAEVSRALDYMLAQQEPFPAVAVDRHWNLLRSNSGAIRLVEFLVGPLAPDTPVNLADALVAPDVLRPHLRNWAEVVRYFVRSVEADAAADGTPETAALHQRLLAYQGVREALDARRPKRRRRRCCPCISARATPNSGCSRPSRRSAPPRTSRCRSFASNVSFRWTRRPPASCAAGLLNRRTRATS